jgi:UDP-N-acetylglucosamine 1-carboxyvinyltransferase
MDAFRIQGGPRLAGRITVDGSKNAALPLMAAALLADEPVVLRRVPHLVDIANMIGLLKELGCAVKAPPTGGGTITIENVDLDRTHARYDIVRTMRASICVLGPLLARRGIAAVSMPGGCAFGPRPVDLHLRGLEALGAKIELQGGDIVATAPEGGLVGATIFLGGPFGSTVLGTANVMSAATLAKGRTIIESAACEPEILDLASMLNSMGAKITGAGSPRIIVDGVDQLGGTDHAIIPDRIVAGTYAIAAAITNGDVTIEDFPYNSLLAVVDRLGEVGVNVKRLNPRESADRCCVQVTCNRHLNPAIFTTQPYPGFPTDLQAQLMSLLCIANGNSIITEKIYPERFQHVAELSRMGAQLFRQGPTVVVQGVKKLVGAPVMASDLRGSACMVLAGLIAEGETIVSRVYHLDRGYTHMEEVLKGLGAKIERFNPDASEVESTPYLTLTG